MNRLSKFYLSENNTDDREIIGCLEMLVFPSYLYVWYKSWVIVESCCASPNTYAENMITAGTTMNFIMIKLNLSAHVK
jgi:hypothetical protein